jgi:hypothetical protein
LWNISSNNWETLNVNSGIYYQILTSANIVDGVTSNKVNYVASANIAEYIYNVAIASYATANIAASTANSANANSGVTAGTYGGAGEIPVITINSRGQITAASNLSTGGGVGTTQTAVQIADQTVGSFSAASNLAITLAANTYYAVEVFYNISYTNPMDVQVTFSGTSYSSGWVLTNADSSPGIQPTSGAGVINGSAPSVGSNAGQIDGNPSQGYFKGYIATNAGGTLGFSFGNSSGSTLRRGSYITALQVG